MAHLAIKLSDVPGPPSAEIIAVVFAAPSVSLFAAETFTFPFGNQFLFAVGDCTCTTLPEIWYAAIPVSGRVSLICTIIPPCQYDFNCGGAIDKFCSPTFSMVCGAKK